MKLIEYADQDMMMLGLAGVLASALTRVLSTGGDATLVVPGGTTPGPVFDNLCAVDLDWARVTVLLSDERGVPENSDRSNARLLRERLLVGPAAAANFLPLYAPTPRPEDALNDLNAAITPHLPVSVSLLGMGADMHTASLFPGADQLAAALAPDAPPLLAMRAPGADEPRITLSAPVLKGALQTHVVITGAEKRAALESAEAQSDPLLAPIKVVLADATVHWAE